MYKKLDQYLLSKFLKTFFFTTLIFVLISVVIELSERMAKFLDPERDVPTDDIIFIYFPTFVIYIVGQLWPMFCLISVIFFTSRLAHNSEIISIFNAGVSFRRFLRPYMIGAFLLAGILFVGNHYFIPVANGLRHEFSYEHGINKKRDQARKREVHLFLSPTSKVFIQNYRTSSKTASNFQLETYDGPALVERVFAQQATWVGPPDQWRLTNYTVRRFDRDGKETFYTEPKTPLDTSLALTPEEFVDVKEQHEQMTSFEIKERLDRMRVKRVGNTEKYEVELQRRLADPVTILILTLIGATISARKVRGGTGLHLAIGIGIGATYILLNKFSIVFATEKAVPVWLGIWLPNVIFLIVSIFLLRSAQR